MKPELIFKIVAAILMVIAAVFYYQQNWDAVFASVVVGICAFFLSIRFEAKARVREAEEERRREQEALFDAEYEPDENNDSEDKLN